MTDNRRKRWIDSIDPLDTALRIACAWDSTQAKNKVLGCAWYARAHRWCVSVAEVEGLDLETVCGVVAALSPGVRWIQNRKDALGVLAGSEKVTTYRPQYYKAIRIRDGEDPLKVLHGPKEKAFYQCLLKPDTSDEVCVDRHAYKVALDWYAGEEWITRWNNRVGVYDHVATAYRYVANLLGVRPHQLQAATWLWYRDSIIEERYRSDGSPDSEVPF